MSSKSSPKDETDISRYITEKVQNLLWGVSSGRCEFQGCNRQLYINPTVKEQENCSQKAHIRAVSAGGARHLKSLTEYGLQRMNGVGVANTLKLETRRMVTDYDIANNHF